MSRTGHYWLALATTGIVTAKVPHSQPAILGDTEQPKDDRLVATTQYMYSYTLVYLAYPWLWCHTRVVTRHNYVFEYTAVFLVYPLIYLDLVARSTSRLVLPSR